MAYTSLEPHLVDGEVPPDSAHLEVYRSLEEIGKKMGVSFDPARRWAVQMHDAGFVNVENFDFPIPVRLWDVWPEGHFLGEKNSNTLINVGFESYLLRGWTQAKGEETTFIRAA